jgi:hypothetical protein
MTIPYTCFFAASTKYSLIQAFITRSTAIQSYENHRDSKGIDQTNIEHYIVVENCII